MREFLTKSILRRIFIYFLIFGSVLFAVLYFFSIAKVQSLSIEAFGISLVVFLVYFLLVYFYEFVRPMNIVMEQVRALLGGKKYKRIFTARIDEIGILAHFFNEVTKSFEKVSVDIKEGKRMLSELEIASKIQKDILPPQTPKVKGLEIVAKTRPAVELGGDNFDFITKGDNTFIYAGDVTGHGVPAALIMTMVNTLIHTLVEVYTNAYDVVVNTNKQLKNRIKSTMFMTLLMLKWNHVEQKMTFVGCGHEHLLIYRTATGKCEVRQTGGIALGMVPDNSKLIKESEIPLQAGDVIVLYSDGLTEGRNMAGEMYGLDRLVAAIEKFAPQYGPDGIVNHVALDYSQFVQNHIQEDDVTLIAIRHAGSAAEQAVQTSTAWVDMEKPQAQIPATAQS